MSDNKYCLYRHLKPNGEVFYIGEGLINRPFVKSDRSNLWWKIVNKYGYEIEILKIGLTKKDAQDLEKILISWYGRKNLKLGTLCNLTDGGDGHIGHIQTQEHKNKISNALKGIKRSEYMKQKVSETQSLRKGLDRHQSIILLDPNTGVYYYSYEEYSKLYHLASNTCKRHVRKGIINLIETVYE